MIVATGRIGVLGGQKMEIHCHDILAQQPRIAKPKKAQASFLPSFHPSNNKDVIVT